MATDKISKINKIEGSKKAQAVVKKAQNATSGKAKKTSAKVSVRAKAVKNAVKKEAKNIKVAVSKAATKSKTLALGSVALSEKKVAKVEAFFKEFLKDAKTKSEFLEAAILKQIKKHKKKKGKCKKDKKADKAKVAKSVKVAKTTKSTQKPTAKKSTK